MLAHRRVDRVAEIEDREFSRCRPSGCGKSTTLGMMRPEDVTSGEIFRDLCVKSGVQDRDIAMVFQNTPVPHMESTLHASDCRCGAAAAEIDRPRDEAEILDLDPCKAQAKRSPAAASAPHSRAIVRDPAVS